MNYRATSFESEKCAQQSSGCWKNRNTKEFMMLLACELCDFHHKSVLCVYVCVRYISTCSLNEMYFNYKLKIQDTKKMLRFFFLLHCIYAFIQTSYTSSCATRELERLLHLHLFTHIDVMVGCLASVAFNEEIIYAKWNA